MIFEVRTKDGRLFEIKADKMPSDQEINEAISTMSSEPQGQSAFDKIAGAATSFDKGYTFGFGKKLGGVMNVIGAAPMDVIFRDKTLSQAVKDRYSEIVDTANQSQKQFEEENPMAALGLELAGGIANPLNKVGADYIGKGATLGSKIARGAGVGGAGGMLNAVGNDGDLAKDTAIGTVVGGGLPIVGAAIKATAKGAGKIGSKILGKTTGAGEQAIEDAFEAGARGNTGFRDQMRNPSDIDEVVGKAMDEIDKIAQRRNMTYKEDIEILRRNAQKLDVEPVNRQVKRIINSEGGGSKYLVDDETARVLDKADDIVKKFTKDTSRHNTAGFDDLKKAISNIKASPDSNAERVKTEIANSVKAEIMKQNPSYKKVMDTYARDTANLETLKRTFSLDKRANLETTLRKLQSVTRNNANTDYGYRARLLKQIDPNGDIYNAVGASALNSWTPRGLIGGGVAGAGLATVDPMLIASTSPRLVGEAAYLLGKGSTKLPQMDITPYLVQLLTGE